MNKTNKLQRLFNKYRHYNIPGNNSTNEYLEFCKAEKALKEEENGN